MDVTLHGRDKEALERRALEGLQTMLLGRRIEGVEADIELDERRDHFAVSAVVLVLDDGARISIGSNWRVEGGPLAVEVGSVVDMRRAAELEVGDEVLHPRGVHVIDGVKHNGPGTCGVTINWHDRKGTKTVWLASEDERMAVVQ